MGLPPVNFEGHLRLYDTDNNSRAASGLLFEFSLALLLLAAELSVFLWLALSRSYSKHRSAH